MLFLIQVILIFEVLDLFLKVYKIQIHVAVHRLCRSMCSEHACSLSVSGIWEEAQVDLSGEH